MKTPTEILRIAATRKYNDAVLAFKLLNSTYTEDDILKSVKSNKSRLGVNNVFSGTIYLFYDKYESPTDPMGKIMIGEWEKYYIIVTSQKCFLKMKKNFSKKWVHDQRSWSGILEYVDYK